MLTKFIYLWMFISQALMTVQIDNMKPGTQIGHVLHEIQNLKPTIVSSG